MSPRPHFRHRCRTHRIQPSPPGESVALALFAPAARRARDRTLATIEDAIVRAVTGLLDEGVDPYELLTALRLRSARPSSTLVAANALVAASHTAFLGDRGRRQIAVLATAAADVVAGVGWLCRLDRRRRLDSIAEAALDIWRALDAMLPAASVGA